MSTEKTYITTPHRYKRARASDCVQPAPLSDIL